MTVLNILESFNRGIYSKSSPVYKDKPRYVKQSSSELKKPVMEKIAGDVATELNKLTGSFNQEVRFVFHEKTNSIIIRVINTNTDEIIREIPARYSLELLEHFRANMGFFLDESV